MTSSAPRAFAISAFLSELVVAMTLAPMMFLATWMAAVPTPLDADSTRTVSHAWRFARRMSIVQEGMKTVGRDEASTYESESGITTALTPGTLTNSA